MIDLNLTLIGRVHTAACLAAMAAFVPVMFARKGGRRHRVSGKIYAVAYVGVCLTSLGIYGQQGFWFPHWLALGGLIVLAAGYLAVRVKPRHWRPIHVVAMLLSGYNLFGGAVNEVYLRVGPLRTLAGTNILDSPIVGMTHAAIMLMFVLLIGGYLAASIFDGAGRGRTAAPEGS